jgi:hypothetical protein
VRPGRAAAHLLGFTTRNPARVERAADGLSLPRLIVGRDAVIHTRRPEVWRALPVIAAALLGFLRVLGSPQRSDALKYLVNGA